MGICTNRNCSGCAACCNICPQKCIYMNEDEYGVLYPVILDERCLGCGLCKKVCPLISQPTLYEPYDCYAAYQSNQEVRKSSASGGLARAFYESFITCYKGYVYGVIAEKDQVFFMGCDDIATINRFQGSQYTQANIGSVYKQIVDNLKFGREVLFIGCPCQVAACINFVKESRYSLKNLFTIDLLCHGVTPQKYLKEELQYLANKKRWSEYSKVTFRTNQKGKNYRFNVNYQRGNSKRQKIYSVPALASAYFSSFVLNISLRESCYHCIYSCLSRSGDITIGDFIGLASQKCSKPYDGETNNVSVVLVNTKKGERLFSLLSDSIIKYKRSVSEAYLGGASLQRPAVPSVYREKFLELYIKYGFAFSSRKILKSKIVIAVIKDFIKRALRYVK